MINNLEKDFKNLVAAAGSKEERTVLNEFFEKYQLHEKGIESLLKKSVDKAGKQVDVYLDSINKLNEKRSKSKD